MILLGWFRSENVRIGGGVTEYDAAADVDDDDDDDDDADVPEYNADKDGAGNIGGNDSSK